MRNLLLICSDLFKIFSVGYYLCSLKCFHRAFAVYNPIILRNVRGQLLDTSYVQDKDLRK